MTAWKWASKPEFLINHYQMAEIQQGLEKKRIYRSIHRKLPK